MDDWRSKKKLGVLKKQPPSKEDVNHDKWGQLQINGKGYENFLRNNVMLLKYG